MKAYFAVLFACVAASASLAHATEPSAPKGKVQFLSGSTAYAVHVAIQHENLSAEDLAQLDVVIIPDERGIRVSFVRKNRALGQKGGDANGRDILVAPNGAVLRVSGQE